MTDEDFLSAFENGTLPLEQWNHGAHLRVAFHYANHHELETAIEQMRSGLKAYNRANKVQEELERGYHETITVAFMRLISEAVTSFPQASSFEAFKRRWPQLFNKRVLLRFYSRNRILSEAAKADYVEPDFLPLSVVTFDSNPDHLVVFDVDGTLIQSLGIDDRCFTQSVSEILGVEEISTDWGSYQHQTDAGLIFEIAGNHFGSPPSDRLVERVRERFIHLLSLDLNDEFTLSEVRGASAMLDGLRHHPDWCAAIATGGWERPAKLKLSHAGIQVDDIPFASSDDAVARQEIIECAIQRALKLYRKKGFRRIVYVGDGSWDDHAARQLGIGFIGVTTNPASSVFDVDRTFVVRDFADPQEFIRLLDTVRPFEEI